MLKVSIAKTTTTKRALSIVLVLKKGGFLRFFVNFHFLSTATVRGSYHILRMGEGVDFPRKARLFFTFDANFGYWQIERVNKHVDKMRLLHVVDWFETKAYRYCWWAPRHLFREQWGEFLLTSYGSQPCLCWRLFHSFQVSCTAGDVFQCRTWKTAKNWDGVKLKKSNFFRLSFEYFG